MERPRGSPTVEKLRVELAFHGDIVGLLSCRHPQPNGESDQEIQILVRLGRGQMRLLRDIMEA